MSYKPGDFLIGVSELISVILPGAVASYELNPMLSRELYRHNLPMLNGTGAWVAFAVLTYLLGHLIFLAGSLLDIPYNWLRKWLWPREKDITYRAATEIAGELLGERVDATNIYKFATALMALGHETAFAEIKQLEADSKFFRSLTVLIALNLIAAAGDLTRAETAIAFLLLTACCWRYLERRWKGTRRAFEYVIVARTCQGESP
jgi:hypothetical protein